MAGALQPVRMVDVNARRLASLAAALMLAACGGGGGSSQSPSNRAFTVDVSPPEAPVQLRAAIPGQKTSFLVTFSDQAVGGGPATVSAAASGAKVDRIVPADLKPGEVGEVWVITDPTITADTTVSVTITVSRGGVTQKVDRSILVYPMSSEGRARDAQAHFDFWFAWLVANHPELSIKADTAWEPLFVSTLLVVSHMSYYSADWEMGLAWHAATVPPNDWSEIYLRRRGVEAKPSLAFKLDSFSLETPPYSVPSPEVVVR